MTRRIRKKRAAKMAIDVTPMVAPGRKLISGYGDGGFRLGDERVEGSVLLFPERVLAWSVSNADEITPDKLAPVISAADQVDILLLGLGERPGMLPITLRKALSEQGIVAEIMPTGAACRTFNVLVAEDRPVAAALIAV